MTKYNPKEAQNRLKKLQDKRRQYKRLQLSFIEANSDNSPNYENSDYLELGKAIDGINEEIIEISMARKERGNECRLDAN